MDQTAVTDWLLNLIKHVRESIPPELLPNAGWAGLTLLAIGLLVGVFGAYYAKGILCIVMGGIGCAVGAIGAEVFEFPQLLGGLVGLLGFAAIAYYSYKLLVGILVGLLVSGIALFAYGHDTWLPELLKFDPNDISSPTTDEFVLPTAQQQEAHNHPTLLGYLRGFGQHLKQLRPQVSQNATVLSILALVLGFVFGAFSTRWALILSCAAVGTVLCIIGLTGFAETFAAGGWEERLAQHPNGTLAFMASSFLLSMLVQYRLTQQTPLPQAQKKPTK